MNEWTTTVKSHRGRKLLPHGKKRLPVNATVHPNVAAFLKVCDESIGLNKGQLIDRLVNEKYPSVNID